MEIRARYTLIGLFTLLVTAAGFIFVYWLNHAGGLGQRAIYRAQFQNTVSGLLKGSAVLFNGIRVGEVTELRLNDQDPRQVTAYIAVASDTPMRADTKVGIEFQGLMGSPVVSLSGGAAKAQALDLVGGEPPMLIADANAGQNMTEAARSALRRIDSVVAENSEPLKNVIANINSFSAALARNTDKVDGILAGIERMTGGAKKSAEHVFDLAAPQTLPAIARDFLRVSWSFPSLMCWAPSSTTTSWCARRKARAIPNSWPSGPIRCRAFCNRASSRASRTPTI